MDWTALSIVVVRCTWVGGGRCEDGFGDEGFADGERRWSVSWVFGCYFLAEEMVVQWVCGDGRFRFVERGKGEGCSEVVFYFGEGGLRISEEEEDGFVEE